LGELWYNCSNEFLTNKNPINTDNNLFASVFTVLSSISFWWLVSMAAVIVMVMVINRRKS